MAARTMLLIVAGLALVGSVAAWRLFHVFRGPAYRGRSHWAKIDCAGGAIEILTIVTMGIVLMSAKFFGFW